MAKPLKKRDPHQRADRAYDYLIANKPQVLRYIIAAAATWFLKLLLDWLASAAGLSSLIPFAVRLSCCLLF